MIDKLIDLLEHYKGRKNPMIDHAPFVLFP